MWTTAGIAATLAATWRTTVVLGRRVASSLRSPAGCSMAVVDLVQVEQFLVALGPPARFEIGGHVAYHVLLDCPADVVSHRFCAPDLLVQTGLVPLSATCATKPSGSAAPARPHSEPSPMYPLAGDRWSVGGYI